MAHIDVRDLGRIRTVSGVLARHGFGSLLQVAGLEAFVDPAIRGEDSSPWAVRLRQVLVELGPTFVKLGQVLSVRPDIIPPALIKEFQKLQDEVPPVPWEAALKVLEAELGRPHEEVFAEVQHAPVASASIAQVHFAVLRDGREVALKIQRPGIGETVRSDLHILFTMAQLVEGRLSLPGVYTPSAIVREFERAILLELDFLQEARSAERFRECFRGDERVWVPEIFRAWTSSRVMVMERARGTPLSAIQAGDPRMAPITRVLVDATFKQVFDHGFFHGDPHPGNLLVAEDGRLIYLDFGLCGTLTPEMQDTLVTALVSLVFQDAETLALTIYRSGGIEGPVDLRAFRSEIERMLVKYHGATLQDLSASASLVEFVQVASRYRIRLVPEYALLARAASMIDGILRGKAPETDPVALVRPHAQRLLADRIKPERLGTELGRMLMQAQGGFRQLPTQVNQLLLDLERGQIKFIVVDPDAEALREEIRAAAFRLSLALCAMAVLTAGALLLAAWSPTPWDVPIFGIFGLAVVSVAIAMWVGLVAHTLFGDAFRWRDLRRRAMAVFRFFFGERS